MAPAKLNLYLDVLGRRPDGFHDVETLMVPIALYDRLAWTPCPSDAPSLSLEVAGAGGDVPADESNLAWRAAQALAAEAGVEPYGRMTLVKRIPSQAGLGGGSSDAAATLVLLNRAWDLGYGVDRLAPIAARLGSDVPFFLAGGPAICRGRGEIVEPTPPLPRMDVVVLKPPYGVSTGEAFAQLDKQSSGGESSSSRGGIEELIGAVQTGRFAAAGRRLFNRFEGIVGRVCPRIEQVRQAFGRLAWHGTALSGSGSAWFGLASSARTARRAAAQMSGWRLGAVFAVASCSQSRCKEN